MKKTFLVDYLGCKVNSYEMNAIKTILIKNEYFYDEKNPNVIIINSCSVTSVSDKKSRNLVKKYRKNHPDSIIVVMGCSSQGFEAENFKEAGANIILGNDNKLKCIDYIKNYDGNCIIDINKNFRDFKYEELTTISQFDQVRAYVKIQDGCDNFCSYCLIPYVRGASRSRSVDNILNEIGQLLKSGYKEIVLTGIDVASYGLDLETKMNFSDLLECILTNYPEIYSLRISSIEESMIDEKFIYLLEKYQNIANHMHLSLQSGSNSVLKRMNRKYECDEFYKKVLTILKARNDMCLTTDIIVGFPGETDEEFNETLEFAKKCKFAKLHVFPYSSRKGTVAAKMKNQVDPSIKKERVRILLDTSKQLENDYISKFIGKELEFLVEQYDKKESCYKGHTSNYLECSTKNSDAKVNETYKIIGNFDSVKIS